MKAFFLWALVAGLTASQATTALAVPGAESADSQFTLDFEGDVLNVRSKTTNMHVTWRDYLHHEALGDMIVILDTDKLLSAYRADGKVIFENFTKTEKFWLRPGFVGALDSDGIFEAYSTLTGQRFIKWGDTVQVEINDNMIALLDKNGVFDTYRADGGVIMKDYVKSVSFKLKQEYVAVLDRDGILDVSKKDGSHFIKGRPNIKNFVAHNRAIAILDKKGNLNIMPIDGSSGSFETKVEDIREAERGVEFLRAGTWTYIALGRGGDRDWDGDRGGRGDRRDDRDKPRGLGISASCNGNNFSLVVENRETGKSQTYSEKLGAGFSSLDYCSGTKNAINSKAEAFKFGSDKPIGALCTGYGDILTRIFISPNGEIKGTRTESFPFDCEADVVKINAGKKL